MDSRAPRDQYWASLQDPKLLLSEFDRKIKDYYDDLRNTGVLAVMERSYRAYYGGKVIGSYFGESLFGGSKVAISGKQGEKTGIKVNHFRNFLLHTLQLTTAQKPAMTARATNTDYKSQAQTILGNGLLDYYWREKNVGRIVKDAAEISLVYGEASIHAPWNPNIGEIVTVDETGRPVYEGDQEFFVKNPLDVIRDPSLTSQNDDWKIVQDLENRWNLAAKYTNNADAILASPAVDPNSIEVPSFQLRGGMSPRNDDLVVKRTFYHNKTDAMPEGRLVIFLEDVILFDGPLPYDKAPVYRLSGANVDNTIYGYSIAFDLLSIQGGIDELHTILMSNNKTYGIQSIWTKKGSGLSVTTLGGGMKHLQSDDKPEAVQLTASAKETYDYLDKLENDGETISGVSSTVRGQPEASLKSGTALALVVSQAIQFASTFEEAYYRVIEDIGSAILYNLRDFSQTERVANIIGESSRPFAKTFNADDLSSINRVVCDPVSAMSKTVSGRAQIAENLLDRGLIENAKQYLMVLTTGQLDPAIEGTQHALLNIRAENEELREGRPVKAIITENHVMHVQEHKSLIENPDAKNDPEFIQAVLAHIQEHVNLWNQASPAILAMTGQQPPPPMPIPPQGPPPPQGGPSSAPPMDSTPPVIQQTQNVEPANMPGLPPGSPPEAQENYDKLTAPQ